MLKKLHPDNVVVCGIDPAIKCCGLAVVEVLSVEDRTFRILDKVSTINNPGGCGQHKWANRANQEEMISYWLKPRFEYIDFFCLENYSYGSPGLIADLAEMGGLIKNIIWHSGKPYDVIAPQTVKRIVGGSGKADKIMVADKLSNFITNIDDYKFNNTDESDAVAIAISYVINLDEASRSRKDPESVKESGSKPKRGRSKR